MIYETTPRPPSDRKGFTITSLKDLFHLVDKYPTKEPYIIAWEYVFMDYSWVWIHPRVLKESKHMPEFWIQLEDWRTKGNLVRSDNKSWGDKKKKYAKLTQPVDAKNSEALRFPKILGRGVLSIAYGTSPEKAELFKKKCLAIIKRFQGDDSLADINDLYPRKMKVTVSVIETSEKWVINYAEGVLEINASAFLGQSLSRQQMLLLRGFGLAYFSLKLRPSDMKKWFKYYRVKKPIANRKFYHPDITKLQISWASGLADFVLGEETSVMKTFREYFQRTSVGASRVDLSQFPTEMASSVMASSIELAEPFKNTPFQNLETNDILDIMGLSDAAVATPTLLGGLTGANKVVATDNTFRDIVAYSIETDEGGNAEWDLGEGKAVSIARTIWYNKKTGVSAIENDLFELDESFQGKGIGVRMVSNQIDMCLAKGIQKIMCYAARGDDEYVGYKVWHKMGYDALLTPKNLDEHSDDEDGFYWWVLKSLEKKINEYPEDILHREVDLLLQKAVGSKKPSYFRSLPTPFFSRYMNIRFEEPPFANDWSDLVPTLSRAEIFQYYSFLSAQMSKGDIVSFNLFKDLELSITKDTIQNLMDVEGFEDWWGENGGGYKATLDLSEGVNSPAYMILSLYRQKKGLTKMSSDDLLTKAMGYLSSKDIALFDEARRELRVASKSVSRIATLWLA